jgi:hypothetical protein
MVKRTSATNDIARLQTCASSLPMRWKTVKPLAESLVKNMTKGYGG